ncbi:MAG: PAS domain S-box protein, partial [Cyanobacteria bacterium P01_F01_bin.116]
SQIQQIKQEFHLGNNELLRQVILNLVGDTESPYKLLGEASDEDKMLPIYQTSSNMLGLYCLYLHKAILSYWFERREDSLEYITIATSYLMAATSQATVPLFYFYDSLIRLSLYTNSPSSEQTSTTTQIDNNQKKLEFWASYAPMNFQHKYDLVLAERYSRLGQKPDAIDAYDRAVAGAKRNGYIQEEALANELAAKFYIDWGKGKVAAGYMQEAYYCYARWGAKAKVADLETRYSELLRPILQPSAPSMDVLSTLTTLSQPAISVHAISQQNVGISSINQTLDFFGIFKASQALSSTIQLKELLHQLTHIILQVSGADRCALILPNEQEEWQVRAMATPEEYQLCDIPLNTSQNLPVKLIQYVKNTHEAVVIDDLKTELPVLDDYFRQQQSQSILCLAILNQCRCIGTIFLENRFTRGVFTDERITILKFLCTQTAISLENARLYQLERLKANQLAASEKRLQTLFDQAADAVFLLEEQKIIDCNQAAIGLLGYPNKAALLDLRPDQYSPERQPDGQLSADKIKFMLLEALQRCSLRFEWVHQRYDGEIFWADIILTPIKYRKKVIFHCITRDISDRKQAEVNSRLLASVVESSDDAIITKKLDGTITSWNRAAVDLFGYTETEAIGQSITILFPVERLQEENKIINRIKDKEHIKHFETVRLHKDGTPIDISVTVSPLVDSRGSVVGASKIVRDISDRKRLEQEQARLNAVLEATPDWIGMANAKGEEIWRNQQMRLLRPDIAQQDRPSITNYHPDWVNQMLLNEVLPTASQRGSWSGETAVLDIEGNEIPVSQVLIAHKAADGSIENYSTIMRDISDRKAAEASLRESETKFRTLLSNLDGVVYRCQMMLTGPWNL